MTKQAPTQDPNRMTGTVTGGVAGEPGATLPVKDGEVVATPPAG